MKIVTNIKEANDLLKHYAGAKLEIVMYNISLKRILLRLSFSNIEEVLYVVGVGCESLNGNFKYINANLNIIQLNNENHDFITIIADNLSGFTLNTSGGFALVQGVNSEFGISFDDFLKDI
ncbi:hypothetical protein [Flavobacterium sp. HNIBRBA15423]|uniref:hypothetical protein n=1 Tax=Flavobacterium sp. HNIBRBA15423 TaxID=3458683 RepID=UPI0040445063